MTKQEGLQCKIQRTTYEEECVITSGKCVSQHDSSTSILEHSHQVIHESILSLYFLGRVLTVHAFKTTHSEPTLILCKSVLLKSRVTLCKSRIRGLCGSASCCLIVQKT